MVKLVNSYELDTYKSVFLMEVIRNKGTLSPMTDLGLKQWLKYSLVLVMKKRIKIFILIPEMEMIGRMDKVLKRLEEAWKESKKRISV